MSVQRLTDRVNAIVLTVLRHRLPVAQLPDDPTFRDLTVDAIERVYIADAIEHEWTIELADVEIDGWQTLHDVTESIRRRTGRGQLRLAKI
ncbi:hypothetical protein KRR38_11750 [Novosphingobium sp. G106]|uniref:hypothetical protein n=1 Tax=Novosphingobium sp. G106 TaxID=2849500 RepID=UPI001C2CFE72|nr:hypothetical protein [Novosphingobium sp. G106]MBV1688331.1 hypothetical protein [Novosphingobium sp. G106]